VELDESNELNGPALKGLDLVLIVVRTKSFQKSEIEQLVKYVQEGGALLLVADHTNLDGCQDVFDQIASPFGVTANFDSAFSHRKWWHDNIASPRYFGLGKTESLNFGIGTGASLNAAWPAQPLLIGRYAFGDLGNLFKSSRKEAFLGDYQYQHGETLSDIVLATSTDFGKGRVVCLGDSSSLQNTIYPRASSFVRHLLGWTAQRIVTKWNSQIWVSFGMICLLGILPWMDWRIILALGGLAGLVGAVDLGMSKQLNFLPWKDSVPTAICLDLPFSNINRDGFTDNSYQSLPINLTLEGFATDWNPSIADAVAMKPNLMFLLAPTRSLSNRESQQLIQYVEQGGELVITCDHQNAGCITRVLQVAGISILDQPLGGDLGDPSKGVVRCVNSWGLQLSPNSNLYVTRLGVPLIASGQVGKGRIVVVGDAGFFRDSNLESEEQGSRKNIRLLHDLCAKLRSGPESADWKMEFGQAGATAKLTGEEAK
jgi:hypothetical protein